jgi:chromosome segregation ATPase
MRRALWLAAIAAIVAFPPSGHCQQQDKAAPPSQDPAGSQSGTQAAQASTATATDQQESLAEAARRAREQKKDTPKQAKVITNDNIPKEGGISAVGEEPPVTENADNAPADGPKSDKAAGSDEKKWRARFEKLHHKLEQDQADLDVMQRELGVLDLQYYNDPVKGMQQGLTRSDINEKTAKIAAKQKEIDADKQAISDAEDDLRQAGGDPGWAR